MREPHYIENYNKSLRKILIKRVDSLIGTPYAVNYRTNILSMNIMTHFRAHILKLNELYTLYSKYITITDKSYNTMLFNRTGIIKKYAEERLYASNYVVHSDTLSIEDLIEINKNMSQMKRSLENYKLIYLEYYNNILY